MNDFNNNEIQIIQSIWNDMDFYQSSPNCDISQIKFKFGNINRFQTLFLLNENEVEISELDLITYQFDQLIQLISLVILNLRYPGRYYEFIVKFSKINNRIYNLDLQGFCQLLLTTILQTNTMENYHQFVFIKFLTQFVESIDVYSEDPLVQTTNDDYRLSYSDSNMSSLSLHNADDNSIITVEQSLSKDFFDQDSKRSIDIDELENIDTDAIFNSDSDDDTFDLLNSFNHQTKDKKSNKSSARLSSSNLRPSMSKTSMKSNKNNLKSMRSVASFKSSKQSDCVIM